MRNRRNKKNLPQDAHKGPQSQLVPHDDIEESYTVNVEEVRKDVLCPVCLEAIQNTRAVMECLHRFCKECIEKCLRHGNHECPVCRIHCSSRRSLREDPNFDKLIGELTALLPNSNGNRENLQNARSKASKRKSIAEGKKPATSASRKRLKVKDLGRSSSNRTIRRSPRFAGCSSKSERALPLISEEKEIVFIPDTDITESETKETNVETSEVQAQIAIGTSEEVDNPEAEKVDGIISSAKTLIWGGTGHRSNNRHRSNSMTVAAARINRLARFIDHLEESEVKDNELDIFIKLVSFEEKKIPNLQKPYLSCRPTLSIMKLCQYVALETQRSIEEIELCLVKECHHDIVNGDGKLDPEKCNFEVLARQEETLAELKTNNLSFGHLVIAFKKKIWDWDLNDEYVLSE